MNRSQRVQFLRQSLKNRILVLDGATGTALQEKKLTAQDFGGPQFEGCNEALVLTRPDVIREVHQEYLDAGCDIIETNSFGATSLVLQEYGLAERAYEINIQAARVAREVADHYWTPEKPRFVAGSMGPTNRAISVTGGVQFQELVDLFYLQAKGLYDGGVDYFLVETCQDTRNIKAALLGIQKFQEEVEDRLPVAVSVTVERGATMLAGQSIEALAVSLMHADLLYLGLNCATGPELMTDPIRTLARICPFPVSCLPNAGLPDEHGCYLETPEKVCEVLARFIGEGWINVIGGCCGTRAPHIRAMAKLAAHSKPRQLPEVQGSYLSGIDFLEITDEMRPVIVGERTNVIGSKKFKTLIHEEKFEEASDIARAQIKTGAQIIDVCLGNPDRNEFDDMQRFLEIAARKVRVPLMIDSTDDRVIAMALTHSQGKAIVNSVNLENGEERFKRVSALVKAFGAGLVVGTIDEDPRQGMALTRQRKLEVAERSYSLLTEKYGLSPQDIYWDPLTFPCATGDGQYRGSAVETIEGLRLIKKRFPKTKSILGISNVSFGLPAAGREVLNSVFLYHCVQAGLDLAIVNAEKLVRYASIPEDQKKLAENLLFNRGPDPITAFVAHFRELKPGPVTQRKKLPLLERLSQHIVEGARDGLVEDLEEALLTLKPLEIINGPLMDGMSRVGRLFNANELIVAEVLQSAEVMKAAVSILEPKMTNSEASSRGKILLATVKGDVHDIGKNLVQMILSNNGYDVIDIGIKVSSEQLIEAVKKHNPHIIGLSGLLVKSAHQMVSTAQDLSQAGIHLPMMVGGAALSKNFVDRYIAPAYSGRVVYAADAMSSLEISEGLLKL